VRRPDEAVTCVPLQVAARPGESPDRLVRRFTKRVRNDGVLDEFRVRTAFEKPSVRRRRKRLQAVRLSRSPVEK
jgi:small subunit ribosomal protein S21